MIVHCYGDSTQAGVSVWGGKPYQEKLPPAAIANALLPDTTVVNKGVGGTQLAQYATEAFAAEIRDSDADVIVANWGINDCFIPGLTAYQHRERWKFLAAAAKSAGKTFIIQTFIN